MKLAFAIEHFRPYPGGAERYAWGLASWLAGRGIPLTVLTHEAAEHVPAGVKVELLPKAPAHGGRRLAAAFAGALDEGQFDLIQGFNHVVPCDVLRLGGGVHRAFEPFDLQSIRTPWLRSARRWIQPALPRKRALRANEKMQFSADSRHFIAISERVRRDMIRFYPHCEDRIHLIRNGVDLNVFAADRARRARAAVRQAWGADHRERVLLFASNNHRLKGLDCLLRAMPEVCRRAPAPVKLVVAGKDDCRRWRRTARRLGICGRVLFRGTVEDMPSCYAAADLLVHPSFYDAFGSVVLEAAACGLPAIVSRNCGVTEILEDGREALLVAAPSPPGILAQTVIRALQPDFLASAAAAACAMAESHPIENNYRKTLQVYRQLIGEREPRRDYIIRSVCGQPR